MIGLADPVVMKKVEDFKQAQAEGAGQFLSDL
ncbi:MAG: hypothetical protein ACLVJ6_14230 [Merdibacter sp.]